MNFRQFCLDFRIAICPHGHKHYRRGWVNIECPFCSGTKGFHLGYNESSPVPATVCYRCGGHSLISTISALLGTPYSLSFEYFRQYGGQYTPHREKNSEQEFHNEYLKIDTPLFSLDKYGKKYLINRKFDPDKIQSLYGIKQTAPYGDLSHRIFVPITLNNKLVSYVARTYVNAPLRYLMCPNSLEVYPAKALLYNLDAIHSSRAILAVEGVTDVWRLGKGAVATLGAKVTPAQIWLLSQFEKVYLLSDNDEAGYLNWKNLATILRRLYVPCHVFKTENAEDPANMSQSDADYFMKSLHF